MRHSPRLLLLTIAIASATSGCATLPGSSSSGIDSALHEQPTPVNVQAYERSVRVEVVLEGQIIHAGHGTFVLPGIVATAVHLVDHVPDFAELRVRNVLGHAIASPYVGGHRGGLDGALLFVHEPSSMGPAADLPPLPICSDPIRPAQPVLVATGNSVILSHGSPDHQNIGQATESTDYITHSLPPGSSGSGVYDAASGCLAGLVSQQRALRSVLGDATPRAHTTRLTTASEIQHLIDQIPNSPADSHQ